MKLVIGLAFLVLASSLGVVYSKHESRKLFVELDTLKKERDEMNVEWGRLQLEQSTLATHSRIERTAKKRLNMITPEYEQVLIVRPTK
ncbi:MAG: cell division protein FtsL [Gammaproteobacteria bacterium]|nr:cell division protein FtsL [Gammaproteobacteria bacterium]